MRYLLLLLCFLFSMPIGVLSQEQEPEPPSIQKSTDRVRIDGQYYFIHIVRQGETLYSISNAYDVSQIDIAMENQDIYLGLQPDQALKIPIHTPQDDDGTTKDDEYIYHVVRRGETLYGLSRKYDVPIAAIVNVNPEVEDGIKLSQVVLIPRKEEDTSSDPDTPSDRFIHHEVQPQEGFFSLQRKYGVSEETVRKLNPELVEDGLKLGTILRIPRDPSDTLPDIDHRPPTDGTDPLPDSNLFAAATSLCDSIQAVSSDYQFNVVLMLPFQTDDPNQQQESDTTVANENNNAQDMQQLLHRSGRFLEFYQGALLALDTLKHMGLSVNLWVYDTQKDVETVKQLLNEEGIAKADLIIGPIYPETLKPVADFARERRIPIVSPLSHNNYLLNNNPFLFQVNPSFSSQLEEFMASIDACQGQNMVILHEGDSTNISLINNYKDLLRKRIDRCPNANRIHFKEVTYSPGIIAPEIMEKISHSLNRDRENMILVPSNNEAFVTDLLGSLHTLTIHHNYPISLYGFPRWQRFRNVELDYYYQLQLNLFTPFNVDYSKPLVKWFVGSFRHHYRTEPTQFAFQGYDVTYFFLSAMREFGLDFQYCVEHHSPELTQTQYSFKQINPVSGYENRSIHLIKYTKNYEIKQAEP